MDRFDPPLEFTGLVDREVQLGMDEAIEAQASLVKNISVELRRMADDDSGLRSSVDQYRRV